MPKGNREEKTMFHSSNNALKTMIVRGVLSIKCYFHSDLIQWILVCTLFCFSSTKCLQNGKRASFSSLFPRIVNRWEWNFFTAQWRNGLIVIDRQSDQGTNPSIIKLPSASVIRPRTDAAPIARKKIILWYLSSSCLRKANDDMAHPRRRHDESIRAGEGSRMIEKCPGSKARMWDPASEESNDYR